jgi:hypothetical protein
MDTEAKLAEIMSLVSKLSLVEQTLLLHRIKNQIDEHVELQGGEELTERGMLARYLRSICHATRVPLNPVLVFAKFLNDGIYGPLTDEQRIAVVRIISNAEQLQEHLNEVQQGAQNFEL